MPTYTSPTQRKANKTSANSHRQHSKKSAPTRQLVDNRSASIQQKKQIQTAKKNLPDSKAAVQLSRYRFSGTGWDFVSGTTADTDAFGLPTGTPAVGTMYDANTGAYFDPEQTLDLVGQSTGKLRHKRHQTAYGAHDERSTSSRQGPHNVAAITGGVSLEAGENNGRSIMEVLGSSLAPRPGQARHLRNERLRQKGGRGIKAKDSKKRKRYDKRYEKEWNIAMDTSLPPAKRRKATHKLIEATPAATYRIAEGVASSADMAGKGESRKRAVKDIKASRGLKRNQALPSGLKTVDANGASSKGVKKDTQKRMRAFTRFAYMEQLSDESCDSSDEEL